MGQEEGPDGGSRHRGSAFRATPAPFRGVSPGRGTDGFAVKQDHQWPVAAAANPRQCGGLEHDTNSRPFGSGSAGSHIGLPGQSEVWAELDPSGGPGGPFPCDFHRPGHRAWSLAGGPHPSEVSSLPGPFSPHPDCPGSSFHARTPQAPVLGDQPLVSGKGWPWTRSPRDVASGTSQEGAGAMQWVLRPWNAGSPGHRRGLQ